MTIVRIPVATAQSYEVLLGRGAVEAIDSLVPDDAQRIAVIYAPEVQDLADRIAASFADRQLLLLPAPDGESAKTIEFLSSTWDKLGEAGFTRSDFIVGLGGGATTDVAGFVAASWLRGVRFITIPTTLLAMVDAAVGGKTGINIAAGKNLVGAFHEPVGVICELDTLASLPAAEMRAGLAEIIKCGFIADPTILDDIEADPTAAADPSSELIGDLVRRGVVVKAETVARDLKETGADGTIGREALNYGHTLGHAIERQEGYRVRHGEAISVGMVFVAELAYRTGRISKELLDRHRRILELIGLPTNWSGLEFDELLEAMRLDKKTRGNELRFVVLDDLAHPVIFAGPDEQLLRSAASTLLQV